MKAADLRLNELVGFSQAQLMFLDRRLIVSDLRAFAQFGKDLFEMIGVDHARRILTRYGYFWGQADAQAMKRLFKWDNLTELLRAGARLQTLQGIGKTVGLSFSSDEAKELYKMEIAWHNSGAAEGYIKELGLADHPVCWINTGYASGYASYCIGKSIYFIEQKCKGKGDDHCTAIGADADTWGEELDAYIPYFQADDIKGKIESLTAELIIKNRELENQQKLLSKPHLGQDKTETIPAFSESYKQAVKTAKQTAPLDLSLLITGESGTGKQHLAQNIRRMSNRSTMPFEVVHCDVLSGTLLDSELFGHVAGAFFGAGQDKTGIFEAANGGTVLLDEIGHTNLEIQSKILRVIESGEITRLGESIPRKVNIRVIAASETDLNRLVKENKFRKELYYCLNTIHIHIEPLRKRPEDILPITRAIMKDQRAKLETHNARLDPTCLDYLLDYDWPGNIRELEYVIKRATILSRKGKITPECLPEHILKHNQQFSSSKLLTLAQVEQEHIKSVIEHFHGNKKQAAEALGIGLTTLWRKLK